MFLRRFKGGKKINHRPEFKMKKIKIHLNHALEIRDVCEGDSGLYTVVLKNAAAGLERRLNITLVVNGNQSHYPKVDRFSVFQEKMCRISGSRCDSAVF